MSAAAHGALSVTRTSRTAQSVADYWALTKPEVNFLIAIATFAGFYLAGPSQAHEFPFVLLIHTLIGTLLAASGAGALNQFVERHFDAQMRRTARRPLPEGRIEPCAALKFGVFLSLAGCAYLALAVNVLACFLAGLTLLTYLFAYTPLKRKTPLCMLVGSFPGAVPPLIGWAAAASRLNVEAWVLFAMLLFWQFPHFMAIAWMYREDYAKGGYLVLPLGERAGSFMAWQSVVPALALMALSLAPVLLGRAGAIYLVGASILSLGFVCLGAQLALCRSRRIARRLLLASIVYLPVVFVLLVFDKR